MHYKLLLALAVILSSRITYSMEIVKTTPIKSLEQSKHDIYTNAEITLRTHDIKSRQSIQKTIDLLTQLREIKKNYNINEKALCKYAQQQLDETSLISLSKSKYHRIILFERMYRYHENIDKNEFITPTTDQYVAYEKNRTKKQETYEALGTLQKISIFLNEKETIDSLGLENIPLNVATEEFRKLFNDIDTIKKTEKQKAQTMAELLIKKMDRL
jgi:hypothetical protein